jgi:hypothetical protein
MPGEATDPGEHLERPDVEIWSFPSPRVDEIVDLVERARAHDVRVPRSLDGEIPGARPVSGSDRRPKGAGRATSRHQLCIVSRTTANG